MISTKWLKHLQAVATLQNFGGIDCMWSANLHKVHWLMGNSVWKEQTIPYKCAQWFMQFVQSRESNRKSRSPCKYHINIVYIYISIYMIIRDDSYSNFAASKHCQTKNPASPVENWDWCLYNTDSTWRIFTPGLSELGAKRHVKYIVNYRIPWYWWIIVVRSSSMYVQCVFIFVFPLWLLDAIGSYMFIINPHETSYSC